MLVKDGLAEFGRDCDLKEDLTSNREVPRGQGHVQGVEGRDEGLNERDGQGGRVDRELQGKNGRGIYVWAA